MKKLSVGAQTKADGPATLAALSESMDTAKVDKSVVLQVVTKETQHESALRFAKSIESDCIIPFGSVLPTSVHALEYVWKISDEALKGMKLHPALQRFDLSDEKYDPVFDLARACGLVVTIHMGWDPSYPNELNAPPAALIRIVKNFPGLKIVAAHLGGLRMARDVLEKIAGKTDVYMDTAYCDDTWLDAGLFRDIVRAHGAEKILLGSDYPWHLPTREISFIRSLGLSCEEETMILGENAKHLLGLES